ncbi:hypothetical protein Nepgr_007182 [Nepenthes gracilis]|uniref:Late embryogenesis abundant protein LEA-2 subgroup domain-containing protein n=1 Tax=Nepenthes gracilis TaxID=150966 RepID=A0AAD3S781_NEPGR|nr:hypothetical protein Nepgr_007182 [Nepenthes gracilis]
MYYSGGEVPVQTADDDRRFERRHTARHYAHRVGESLTTRVSKMICTVFLFILFVLGLIAFIMWLSLRPHRPRFHIVDFSIPALAQPNGFENAQISFNVTIRNSNRKITVHYDSIQGAVYYRDVQIGGETLVTEAFDQDPKTTTAVSAVLSGATLTVNSQRWMEFLNDRAVGNVDFRLEITSVIKFNIYTWHSRRHKMHANCDVAVGQDGQILASARNKRCPVYFT